MGEGRGEGFVHGPGLPKAQPPMMPPPARQSLQPALFSLWLGHICLMLLTRHAKSRSKKDQCREVSTGWGNGYRLGVFRLGPACPAGDERVPRAHSSRGFPPGSCLSHPGGSSMPAGRGSKPGFRLRTEALDPLAALTDPEMGLLEAAGRGVGPERRHSEVIRGKAGARPVQGRCKAAQRPAFDRVWSGLAPALIRMKCERDRDRTHPRRGSCATARRHSEATRRGP